jgi:hypothetical protein
VVVSNGRPTRGPRSRQRELPEEERHGRRRGGASAGQSGLGLLARQIEKRTSVPESAMAVAASAYPADEDDDAAILRSPKASGLASRRSPPPPPRVESRRRATGARSAERSRWVGWFG